MKTIFTILLFTAMALGLFLLVRYEVKFFIDLVKKIKQKKKGVVNEEEEEVKKD